MATSFDMSAVVAALGDGGTAIATVGAAVLVFFIGMKVWKRLRGVL